MSFREELAEAMVPVARRWISAVHRQDRESIERILATLPEGRVDVLALVLGAMLDPEDRPEERLAWTAQIRSDPDTPFERERRRLESIPVDPVTAATLARLAVAQTPPELVGLSPLPRAEAHVSVENARRRDRDRKRREKQATAGLMEENAS